MYPYSNPSLLARGLSFVKNVKWGSLLDGAGKTLGVINQAIPVVYQIKPIVSNAKTLFKIANVINSPTDTSTTSSKTTIPIKTTSNNSPIFYI